MSPNDAVLWGIGLLCVGVSVTIIAASIGVTAAAGRQRPWAIAAGIGLAAVLAGLAGIVGGIIVGLMRFIT